MYIGRPGLGVLKLITFFTAPMWGAIAFFTGTLVGSLEGLTVGEARGVVFVAVLVGLAGVIWWFADLFLIRDAACAMRLNPYCIDPDTIDLDDEDDLDDRRPLWTTS